MHGMGIKGSVGRSLAPHVPRAAPDLTAGFVREALHRAIRGVGPLPAAHVSADKALAEHGGDVKRAVREVIDDHVRYAGAQGFVTNLGGVLAAALAIPANLTGLALVQCRMIAAVAHLHGYDLADPRVHNAILAILLGEDDVERLVKKRRLPTTPMALATAPVFDPDLDVVIATEVAAELIAKVAGKRLAVVVGRRVPVVGGLVGLGADGVSTWRVGRYAARELLPRARR
jgi:hypothetical protein